VKGTLNIHKPKAKAAKDLGLPIPVLQFKIYPQGRNKFFEIFVYKTWQDHAKVRRIIFPDALPQSVWGFTAAWWQYHLGELCENSLGGSYFYLKACTDNIVAHEMFHCAMLWSYQAHSVIALKWQSRCHEETAEAHGNLVSQFWKEFTKKYKRVECWGFEEF
jgi:hypothetical protein